MFTQSPVLRKRLPQPQTAERLVARASPALRGGDRLTAACLRRRPDRAGEASGCDVAQCGEVRSRDLALVTVQRGDPAGWIGDSGSGFAFLFSLLPSWKKAPPGQAQRRVTPYASSSARRCARGLAKQQLFRTRLSEGQAAGNNKVQTKRRRHWWELMAAPCVQETPEREARP